MVTKCQQVSVLKFLMENFEPIPSGSDLDEARSFEGLPDCSCLHDSSLFEFFFWIRVHQITYISSLQVDSN